MTSDKDESLSEALVRVASDLEATLTEVRRVHDAYSMLPRRLDTLADEILARRTRVELYAATQLVESLREESVRVGRRAPDLTVAGTRLPRRPPSEDPVEVRDWWASLSPEDQEDVVVTDPVFAGAADGLPASVRHRANLLVLDAEIVRRSSDAPEIDDPTDAEVEEAALVQEQHQRDLRGLRKLRALLMPHTADDSDWTEDRPTETLAKVTTPPEERLLYLLDAGAYPLKAAVVFGDLDTAEHVVLHVPGATTTVDQRLFREATWMSNLRAEAGRHVGIDKVAVIDWIGYQAPYDIAVRTPLGDSGVALFLPGEATDPRYAREAVPALVRCAEGVRAITDDVRLVASGHSYGGSVIGLGLAATDMFDVAVVSGCPGIFTTDVADLQLPPGSMYAVSAPGDVIALLGVFGAPTPQVAGIRSVSTRARTVTYPDGGRALLLPAFGHESYYNVGTATLHAIGAVAAGALDQVKASGSRGGVGDVGP